jgi:hypothetical protein
MAMLIKEGMAEPHIRREKALDKCPPSDRVRLYRESGQKKM